MFRRPEGTEIAAAVVSMAMLGYVYVLSGAPFVADSIRFPEVVRACTVMLMACLVAESSLRKRSYRGVALVLHLAFLVVTLLALRGMFLVGEIMLVCTLIVQISLRFRTLPASLLNVAVLAAATSIGASVSSTGSDRVPVILCGAIFALWAEAVTYYREVLLDKDDALAFQTRSVENLEAANHAFVAHLESVEKESAERERHRITRELHDSIGYAMTNMLMMMNASQYLIEENPGKLLEYCAKTKELATSTLTETRNTLYRLRSVGIQKVQNLPVFFITMCRDFGNATGVQTECHVGNLPMHLDEAVFNTVFRAVQVAFINALRHGNARRIRLSFWLDDQELRMQVWNDAHQATSRGVPNEGIGLSGIRERLIALGGGLSYRHVVDGFSLDLIIPFDEE